MGDVLDPLETARRALELYERFSELGGDHPIPYTDDQQDA